MEKKYKLTDETINIGGTTLYRIKALKNFSDVKKGDKGGFVESEDNLSHDGDCWIYNNAKAYGKATVFDHAKVFNNANKSNFYYDFEFVEFNENECKIKDRYKLDNTLNSDTGLYETKLSISDFIELVKFGSEVN